MVKINNRETLIMSIYLDSKLKVVQPWLTAAMTFASHRGYAIIIGTDSNCHSELYGLETNNHLEDFIGQYNLRDHNTIKYEIVMEQEDIPPTRKWVKMDWNDFRHTLTTENIRIMDTMTTSRLEKCLEQWYTQIENAIDKHCPKRKNKPKDLNNPWWSS